MCLGLVSCWNLHMPRRSFVRSFVRLSRRLSTGALLNVCVWYYVIGEKRTGVEDEHNGARINAQNLDV